MSNRFSRLTTRCPAVGHAHHAMEDLAGRTAVVTGAASGIGYFAAEGLARLGAHVVIAGRNPSRAQAAQRSIRAQVPGARVTLQPLDLADLSSVRSAAEHLTGSESLDLLVANAGAIGYPDYMRPKGDRGPHTLTTADGHELFWGTNFLGHYLLIAVLLPMLLRSSGRCVVVGSLGDRGAPHPADAVPTPDGGSTDFAKYCQSKLALSAFTQDLARRLASDGGRAAAIGAHPGTAGDAYSASRPGVATNQEDPDAVTRVLSRLVVQGKHDAALPLLTAAACAEARNGDYWGPRLLVKGAPVRSRPNSAAGDPVRAAGLIDAAAGLTGVRLPLPTAGPAGQ